MLIPIDSEIGGGWGPFRVEIPEFNLCFNDHDWGYIDIANGTSLITLTELDRQFLRNMLRKAWAEPELWKKVKLTRYAWYCYTIARGWAKTVRRQLLNWRPGDPAIMPGIMDEFLSKQN